MTVTLVFHGNLQELLPEPKDGKRVIIHSFDRRASIKDMVESFGVPHPEIEKLTVNSREVSFDYILLDKDWIEAWPLTPPFDVFTASILRPEPLEKLSFMVDVNVGKLASLLRMLGFDTCGRNNLQDSEIAAVTSREGRILLTRDCNLLKRKNVVYGHLIREIMPKRQLAEVVLLFGLKSQIRPFLRCMCCNRLLVEVTKEEIVGRLEPLTRKYYDSFRLCPGCDRIYWSGSHKLKMEEYLDIVRNLED